MESLLILIFPVFSISFASLINVLFEYSPTVIIFMFSKCILLPFFRLCCNAAGVVSFFLLCSSNHDFVLLPVRPL